VDLFAPFRSRAADHVTEAELLRQLESSGVTVERLSEAISELEMRLMDREDVGWDVLGSISGEFDFSRDFLDRIIRQARVYAIKNPLIKRAVQVYTVYVWGQGVTITGKGEVNDVVQAFLSDKANRRSFTGHKARTKLNRALMTDGTVFLRFFPNKSTGRVIARSVDVDQIRGVVKNPDDADEVWFYRRVWSDAKGATQTRLYPDIAYRPSTRPAKHDGIKVEWDTPMYMHAIGQVAGMDFGIPEVYASVDWSRAVKEYLSDWKKFVRSLNRWAWQMKTTADQAGVDAAQAKLNTQFSEATGTDANPAPVGGSVAVSGKDVDLQPLKVGGAAVKADDVRQIKLETFAGVGLPETFFGDATAGSLATAKSLDRPTELIFSDYQSGWGELLEDVCEFVVDWAARAPNGPLRHLFASEDPETGCVVLKDADAEGKAVDRALDVDWPPIVHDDVKDMVTAIVLAVKTGAIDDAPLVARMLLTALGEEDIDAALQRLYPPEDEEPEAIPIKRPAAPPTPPSAGEPPSDAPATERLAQALEQLRLVLPGT
jgi:hypothetical protein